MFDSEKELSCLSVDRLFVLQKHLIKEIEYYLLNNVYDKDKNDIFNIIQQLLIVNTVIRVKIKKYQKVLK